MFFKIIERFFLQKNNQKNSSSKKNEFVFEELLQKKRKELHRKKKYTKEQYLELLTPYLNEDYSLCTHSELVNVNKKGGKKVLLLRHDVDHDIETAIRMAHYEAKLGIRSTYCILHTAWYYNIVQRGECEAKSFLLDCCKEISHLGHEINFHNNLVTEGLFNGVNIREFLKNELYFFRNNGIEIFGTSTHGDKNCRDYNYRNFEIFDYAVKDELGGIRNIYNKEHSVKLGEFKLSEFELTYEAYDFHRDLYITDSGGALRCMKDAPGRNISHGHSKNGYVVGILTHPIWWGF